MTALGVAAVLAMLGVVCLSLMAFQNRAQAHEQQAIQAVWCARAGRETYLATGQLPPANAQGIREWTLGAGQRCRVTQDAAPGTLVFEGLCGPVNRKLTCVAGDPSRLTEEP